MPGFGDSAFIILLALLLFGPKKLPVLARQLGKLMGDFRRASNEFRTQMEEELRISEQAERQKQIAALEASAPPSPPVDLTAGTEPHTPPEPPAFATPDTSTETPEYPDHSIAPPHVPEAAAAAPQPDPLPIASAGDVTMMPPATGLPVSRTPNSTQEAELETETLHG